MSAETNVEDTLWLCLAVLIAVVVTRGGGTGVCAARPGDEVLLPMTERLSAVEELLSRYAEGRAPDPATEQKIVRLAMLGTSLLRRILTALKLFRPSTRLRIWRRCGPDWQARRSCSYSDAAQLRVFRRAIRRRFRNWPRPWQVFAMI